MRWARAALLLLLAGCAGSLPGEKSPTARPATGSVTRAETQAAVLETQAVQPEAASGFRSRALSLFARQAVAAAHPLAAEAGARILREGGSAVDAAIAVQMVLGLVEPQSSGLGGGAFLLHADAEGRVSAYDGRETAPQAVDEGLFLDTQGRPIGFADAAVGGRAVGVPGLIAMLEAAHRRHGRLPWARLFEPAIEHAEQGFAVGARLHTLLAAEAHLPRQAAARLYYTLDGRPLPVGMRLRNPALAQVMRQLARDGAAAFYRGPVADSIVQAVQGHPTNPGRLGLADLAAYRAEPREALCAAWRRWRLCGFPPPSSGHLALLQILALDDKAEAAEAARAAPLEAGEPGAAAQASVPGPDGATVPASSRPAALPAAGPSEQPTARDAAPALHRYTEAARLAFADRALHVADPAFVEPPAGRWSSLLDADYLQQRAALIGPRSLGVAPPGQPGAGANRRAAQAQDHEAGTSHLSIIDAEGQAVVMTTTIEDAFGSRLLVDGGTGLAGGFLLNNQLTDFAFAPRDAAGRPVANRAQPGKRPRSSMSPTLVFECEGAAAGVVDGAATGPVAVPSPPAPRGTLAPEASPGAPEPCRRLTLLAGSAGGAFIIHHVARLLQHTLLDGQPLQAAVEAPHAATLNGPTLLEAGRFAPATLAALRERGHEPREIPITSGLHALQRVPGGWAGGVDPRREGAVRGD